MVDKNFKRMIIPFLGEIDSAKNDIVNQWIERKSVVEILAEHKITSHFFKKYVGDRIFERLVCVVTGRAESGDCPILHILHHFSYNKKMSMEELFIFCAEFKNSIVFYYMKNMHGKADDKLYWHLMELMDNNFIGVITSYVNENFDIKDNSDTHRILQHGIATDEAVERLLQQRESGIDDDRLKDIRFTKHEKYNSQALFEMLDIMLIDKIEQFTEDLDELLLVFYDIDETNSDDSYRLMKKSVNILGKFYLLVDSFVLFPVIVNSFKNLSTFLEGLSIEFYSNLEQKHLLIENLVGLIKDLEQWIDIVFIQKKADDVHYLDASFANNVLEIESICSNKQMITDEEDDLEFF